MDISVENEELLQEWAPLDRLLEQIPKKSRHGLFTTDVRLTAVAALPDFLAIGTNLGFVYWYNRQTHELEKLWCETTSCAITCVAVISSIEYLIAAGGDNGTVTIFIVPKSTPDNLPETLKPKLEHQKGRYIVRDLHFSPVSALEWSKNGMKLFSGDKKGLVVLTEIDFQMHMMRPSEILNEQYEIVQLSYYPPKQYLLISTFYRTILCHQDKNEARWKVIQVGNKERKTLGKMGATFFNNSDSTRVPLVYCSRPGLRVWLSNLEGTVEKTIMFKNAFLNQHSVIQLLNSTRPTAGTRPKDFQFGPIFPFKKKFLITYCPKGLLVLNPDSVTVINALYDIQEISSLCVTPSEIFLLEGERHLLRLGFTSEKLPENFSQPNTSSHTNSSFFPFTKQILELTNKIRDSTIFPVVPVTTPEVLSPTKSSGSSDSEHISESIDALDLPPVVSLNSLDSQVEDCVPQLNVSFPSPSLTAIPSTSSVRDEMSHSVLQCKTVWEAKDEDIVHRTKRKHSKSKMKSTNRNLAVFEPGLDNLSIVSDGGLTSMDSSTDWSNCGLNASRRSSTGESHYKELPVSLEAVSDVVDLNSIKEEIALKERMVAKKYNLESVLGISEDATSDSGLAHVQEQKTNVIENLSNGIHGSPADFNEENLAEENTSDKEDSKERSCEQKVSETALSNRKKNIHALTDDDSSSQPSCSRDTAGTSQLKLESCGFRKKEITGNKNWHSYSTPKPIVELAVCDKFVVCVDESDEVYYFWLDNLQWMEADYEASNIALSPTADHVWRLENSVALRLKNPFFIGKFESVWEKTANGIRSIAINDQLIWIVSCSGDISYQSCSGETPKLMAKPDEDWTITKVVCFNQTVWVLLSVYEVYMRIGISTTSPEGGGWRRVNIPVPGSALDIALGAKNTGFIIDINDDIFFSINHVDYQPCWWQISLDDHQVPKIYNRLHSTGSSGESYLPSWSIAAARESIWISHKPSNTLLYNQTEIRGHQWIRKSLETEVKWQTVKAEGIFENIGRLWLLSNFGDLYCCRPQTRSVQKIPLPNRDGKLCIAASSESLLVLTTKGEVFERVILANNSLGGEKWKKLSLGRKDNFKLTHISYGMGVLWACDRDGIIYVSVSIRPISLFTCVDDRPTPIRFTKVFVGPESYMVWALDSNNLVFVREGIFPQIPSGISWVFVRGVTAVDLTISGSAVWALSTDGKVYRRCGISDVNYIGDSWEIISGSLQAFSASMDDQLWGIDKSGNLIQHSELLVNFTKKDNAVTQVPLPLSLPRENDDEDWELI